jgi:hypothetical protein
MPEDVPQDERGDDRIVQWSGDRDELRDEVDGRDQPHDRDAQQDLRPSGDPLIGEQASEQHEQVGDEGDEFSRRGPSTGRVQDDDGHDPKGDGYPETNQQPSHAASLCALVWTVLRFHSRRPPITSASKPEHKGELIAPLPGDSEHLGHVRDAQKATFDGSGDLG